MQYELAQYRSINVRTIQDTLCIKGHCELYLRICINLLSHTCLGSLYFNYALGQVNNFRNDLILF